MILIVIFSIKMVSVASVCVTVPTETLEASAYLSCNDRPDGSFSLFIDEGLANGGAIALAVTQTVSTLRKCAEGCNNYPDCSSFDYNCQTGYCILYTETGSGIGTDQLFFADGHISAVYY